MNSRLLQFIHAENISQSQFADSIGVARASVSHILAGRNKPGFDFIGSMARRYPSLNVDWLVTGRGKMYKNAPESPSEAPARQILAEPADVPQESAAAAEDSGNLFQFKDHDSPSIGIKPLGKYSQQSVKQRNITKIIIYYDDNTYQELR